MRGGGREGWWGKIAGVGRGRERWMEGWGRVDGRGVGICRGGWRDAEEKMVGGWGWREVDGEMGKGRWLRVGVGKGEWRDGEGYIVAGWR